MSIMISIRSTAVYLMRFAFALITMLAVFAGHATTAIAQSNNCAQIASMLANIERNPTYASYNGIVGELNARQQQVGQAERQWVGAGCQQTLSAGGALSQQCQSVAQTITLGRSQVQQLQSMAQEGQTMARNYQMLNQDFQRFNCAANQSGVTFANQDPSGNLLNDLFGGGQGGYVNSPYDPWSSQQTRRTVCVRTTDGFYWPISFSTTDQYVAQDAIQCHEMCPGGEVALFSYRNPGEEPEDMISLSGTPYRSMPYAFKFRTEIDKTSSCKIRPSNSIQTVADAGSGSSIVALAPVDIPLPQADPRGPNVAVIEVAEAIYVPLPRPRPRDDGTAAPELVQPDIEGDTLRMVDFGDRTVRLVGPETPYVPEVEEEP
ncbi:DUF2865 domain-containing protein [Pelagibacterium luteolum]|uniref:DUF2865 domain-containing protein n=1 Tax=Pelagibacterium luteolum TaxID=440168 RepID=A0A1G7TFD2_9HYPH|nr:DUF2865 domain-containing protein [Pelagibacterium luteolum]SDG33901.1 Protein of unknown function [Pelagibacterium luteolum]